MLSLETLKDQLSGVLREIVGELSGLDQAELAVELTRPDKTAFGDLSTNVALTSFARLDVERKQHYRSPYSWAQALVERLSSEERVLAVADRVEVAGPGFINFFLKDEQKIAILYNFFAQKPLTPDSSQPPVIVDYSSPNVAKSFTVGHLRSTVIGDAIANLLEADGQRVIRDNHLGDWGTQFAKQLVAIERWGDWQAIEASASPTKEMVALYVRFHQEAEQAPELEDEARRVFVAMEHGDERYLALWQKIVDLSMVEFNRIYDRLGVSFDENGGRGYGESFVRDRTDRVIAELRAKNLLTTSQDAQVVEFSPEDKLPPFLILKKDGSSLYQTRELAMDQWRRENYGDAVKIITEAGREQSLYFRQLIRTEQLLGWFAPGQHVHVGHGLYRFRDRKMSTRKGDVIWLDDILQEAERRVRLIASPQLAAADVERIVVGAIKWNDLAREPILDIDFDFQTVISLKGNSGPYMQYSARRAISVLEKANLAALGEIDMKSPKYRENLSICIQKLNTNELAAGEWELLDAVSAYPQTRHHAAQKLAPNLLTAYLYDLAQLFNSYYAHTPIAEQPARLVVTAAVAWVLTDGLRLLGIAVPDQM